MSHRVKQPKSPYVYHAYGVWVGACCLFMANEAYASTSAMADVLCTIVNMLYGNIGRGIATLAIMVIGMGAALGKTSWGLALTVAIGISIIFSAGIVVGYFTGIIACP